MMGMMGIGVVFMLLVGLLVIGLPLLLIVLIAGGGAAALARLIAGGSRPAPSNAAPSGEPGREPAGGSCPTCGREVRAGWNLCPSCGAALT